MSDYTLTYRLNGETATDAFRYLRHALAAMDGLRRNPGCESAVLQVDGYEFSRHVRDGCRACDGRGHADVGR